MTLLSAVAEKVKLGGALVLLGIMLTPLALVFSVDYLLSRIQKRKSWIGEIFDDITNSKEYSNAAMHFQNGPINLNNSKLKLEWSLVPALYFVARSRDTWGQLPLDIKDKIKQQLVEMHGMTCSKTHGWGCGEVMGYSILTVDHVIPISRGGPVLDVNNMQLLCHQCHERKTDAEQHRATMDSKHAKKFSYYEPKKTHAELVEDMLLKKLKNKGKIELGY